MIKEKRMKFEFLTSANAELYINYLKKAFSDEPDMMFVTQIDETAVKERLRDPFYQSKRSVLAIENGEAVGRIEYHFYGCLQDGYRMAYVDWVYVLRSHRHQGVAQGLFREFERDCTDNDIDQYYLIRATNEGADRFCKKFSDAELDEQPMLRKTLNKE